MQGNDLEVALKDIRDEHPGDLHYTVYPEHGILRDMHHPQWNAAPADGRERPIRSLVLPPATDTS